MKKLIILIFALSAFLTSCAGKNISEDVRRSFMLPSENSCTLEVNGAKNEAIVSFDGAEKMNISFTSGQLEGMTKTVSADSVQTTLGKLSVEDGIMDEPLVMLRKAFLYFGTQNYSSDGEIAEFEFTDGELSLSLTYNTLENRPVCICVSDNVNEVRLNY